MKDEKSLKEKSGEIKMKINNGMNSRRRGDKNTFRQAELWENAKNVVRENPLLVFFSVSAARLTYCSNRSEITTKTYYQ